MLTPNELFEIPLQVGTNRILVTLVVSLPSGFPDIAPIITVMPPVAQRWVSSEMRVVGHEALATWNRNMSLGKIVKDVEIEFNLRPPSLLTIPPLASSGSNAQAAVAASSAFAIKQKTAFPEVTDLRYNGQLVALPVHFLE